MNIICKRIYLILLQIIKLRFFVIKILKKNDLNFFFVFSLFWLVFYFAVNVYIFSIYNFDLDLYLLIIKLQFLTLILFLVFLIMMYYIMKNNSNSKVIKYFEQIIQAAKKNVQVANNNMQLETLGIDELCEKLILMYGDNLQKLQKIKKYNKNLILKLDEMRIKFFLIKKTMKNVFCLKKKNVNYWNFFSTQLKYGEMVAVNMKNIFYQLSRKILVLKEVVNVDSTVTIPLERQSELFTSIENDLNAFSTLNIFADNVSKINLKELIKDVVKLNAYSAYLKKIKIKANYNSMCFAVKYNGFVLLRVLAAILYHTILELPNGSQITIDVQTKKQDDELLLAVILHDDGFGYKLNTHRVRANYFDVRAIRWSEIEYLASSINAKIKVANKPYVGNMIEILCSCEN